MTLEELYHKLITDLTALKMPVYEVIIEFRPYSKTLYGRYFPTNIQDQKPEVYIYPYSNKAGDLMSYSEVLDTAIHEMVHHIQYSDPSFKRKKGVMHNTQFWKLYNHYRDRAISLNIIEEVSLVEVQ